VTFNSFLILSYYYYVSQWKIVNVWHVLMMHVYIAIILPQTCCSNLCMGLVKSQHSFGYSSFNLEYCCDKRQQFYIQWFPFQTKSCRHMKLLCESMSCLGPPLCCLSCQTSQWIFIDMAMDTVFSNIINRCYKSIAFWKALLRNKEDSSGLLNVTQSTDLWEVPIIHVHTLRIVTLVNFNKLCRTIPMSYGVIVTDW